MDALKMCGISGVIFACISRLRCVVFSGGAVWIYSVCSQVSSEVRV